MDTIISFSYGPSSRTRSQLNQWTVAENNNNWIGISFGGIWCQGQPAGKCRDAERKDPYGGSRGLQWPANVDGLRYYHSIHSLHGKSLTSTESSPAFVKYSCRGGVQYFETLRNGGAISACQR